MKNSYFSLVFAINLAATLAYAQTSTITITPPPASATEAARTATPADVPAATISTDGTSTIKDVLSNKKFEDNKVLTDPSLRANDGNLYRYSFKASLAYSGPTLGDTSAQNQPNPDNSVGNFAQKITGNLTLNYRFDSTSSLSAGAGAIMNYPFAGDARANELSQEKGNARYQINNPFLMYNIASRWDSLQMRNSFEIIDSTQQIYTKLGEYGGLNYYNALVYGLGQSRFALSWETSFYYWLFNRDYNPAPTSKGGDASKFTIQQYTLGFTPGVKYNFTDSLNVYTNLGLGWQNPRNDTHNMMALQPRSPSMALGVGYACQRDIYIAPYITTYPFSSDEGLNETTINLTTTFSIL